jgi:hypothetical protein
MMSAVICWTVEIASGTSTVPAPAANEVWWTPMEPGSATRRTPQKKARMQAEAHSNHRN